MNSRLDDLDRCLVARLDRRICRQGHLWQTECARVRVPAGTQHLESRQHVEGHVKGLLAEAHVDVEEGGGVPVEPAGLNGDGAASDWPFGAVLGGGHAAA